MAYRSGILDEDDVSGDDIYKLFVSLFQTHTRDSEYEQKYMDAKKEHAIELDLMSEERKNMETKLRDTESSLSSAHRKISHLVDENLTLKTKIQDSTVVKSSISDPSTEVMGILDDLQTKYKKLRAELQGKQRQLDDATQTIHVQDRTISEYNQKLGTERAKLVDERNKLSSYETRMSDLKSSLQQANTDSAIWRTRYEDAIVRSEKKRKLNDDSYTELISLTSEVNYLRNQHEEDISRIKKLVEDGACLQQQVHNLQVKLALEIGK